MKINRLTLNQHLRYGLVAVLSIYSITVSALLVTNRQQTIVVGIDQFGTRILGKNDDRLLKLEKHNFLTKFITHAYNYTSDTYSTELSAAGDLMSNALWDAKQSELRQINDKIKQHKLVQSSVTKDLREISQSSYQADLEITVKDKLNERKTSLRVDFTLSPNTRNTQNPFPFEVNNYVEQEIL